MKCQNCGFESDNKICSVCGAEIDETQADALQIPDTLSDAEPEKISTEEETKKPKKSVKKILLAVLLIVLSVVIVSASSIGIFYYFTNDSRTEFKKINQTVSLGDFSVKLKEVRTPEFEFDYYSQISYVVIFEIHNNTGEPIEISLPRLTAFCCESSENGYLYEYNSYFEIDGKESKKVTAEIPAWSSVNFTGQIYYEDYSDDLYGYYDDALNSTYDGDGSDVSDSISGDEQENGDEIIIDEGKITYKKEGLQKYKDNSPESFYLILSLNKHFEEEKQYARFLIEPDKQAIQIPEGENIQ